jgi:hypothetical protein
VKPGIGLLGVGGVELGYEEAPPGAGITVKLVCKGEVRMEALADDMERGGIFFCSQSE